MGRNATAGSGGTAFKPEIGLNNAVCCQLIDFGTQIKEWNGEPVGKAKRFFMGFEFPDFTLDGDNGPYHPIWGFEVTNCLGPKANLRKLLEGWRGRAFTKEELDGFDLSVLLGKGCQLLIQPNTNGNPKAVGAVKLAKGTVLEGNREPVDFWIEDDFDGVIPEWMPEWMKEKIVDSDEYTAFCKSNQNEEESPISETVEETPSEFDEDIPF